MREPLARDYLLMPADSDRMSSSTSSPRAKGGAGVKASCWLQDRRSNVVLVRNSGRPELLARWLEKTSRGQAMTFYDNSTSRADGVVARCP